MPTQKIKIWNINSMIKPNSFQLSQNLGQFKPKNRLNLQWLDISFLLEQTAAALPEDFILQSSHEELTDAQQIELAEFFIAKSSDPIALRLNRWFDVAAYEEARPDVKASGCNSSLHYFMQGRTEVEGKFEGSLPGESILRYRANRLIGDESFDPISISCKWHDNNQNKPLKRGSEILKDLSVYLSNHKAVVFSFSHDNAFVSTGGIQKIIREESASFHDEDFCYIHVSPSKPLPFINDILQENPYKLSVDIRIDGSLVGSVLQISLCKLIEQCDAGKTYIIVHHFFGFNISLLQQLINRYSSKKRLIWWVHDYSLNCLSYTLLRDDLEFCDAPSKHSVSCTLCKYGKERLNYLEAIKPVLTNSRIVFVYPSRSALHTSTRGQFGPADKAQKMIVPHAYIKSFQIIEKRILRSERKCRVAFVGQPVRHKGWDEFVSLASNAYLSTYYEWIHIGKGDINIPIRSIYVDGTSNDKAHTMENVLKSNLIDIAFIWPLWPETFCIVALEAFCAGCHIVTNSGSGNVHEFIPVEARSSFQSIEAAHQWLVDLANEHEIRVKHALNVNTSSSKYSLNIVKNLLVN